MKSAHISRKQKPKARSNLGLTLAAIALTTGAAGPEKRDRVGGYYLDLRSVDSVVDRTRQSHSKTKTPSRGRRNDALESRATLCELTGGCASDSGLLISAGYVLTTAARLQPHIVSLNRLQEWRPKSPNPQSRQHLIVRRKGSQTFSEFLAVTRVYRGHVFWAALTRPLARRLCRLQPPPSSPAPCRVNDGRARRSHRPALASRRYW